MVSRVHMIWDLARLAADGDRLEQLHAPVEHGIRSCLDHIESARSCGDVDTIDAIVDSECECIEELLGIGFVTAQTYITSVRTRLARLSAACRAEHEKPLPFIVNEKAYGILKLGCALRSAFTEIEAINAVANYWKHHGEWPTRSKEEGEYLVRVWDADRLRGDHARTAEIVTDLGMSPSSNGNLRTVVEGLGVHAYYDLRPLRTKLTNWAAALFQKAKEHIDLIAAAAL